MRFKRITLTKSMLASAEHGNVRVYVRRGENVEVPKEG